MSKDYALPEFDEYRAWINKRRSKGFSWDEIEYCLTGDENGLIEFLKKKSDEDWWEVDENDWKELVALQKQSEEQTKQIYLASQTSMITDLGEDGNYTVPSSERSSWQLYKKRLIEEKHFLPESVTEIEQSTLKILNRLQAHTDHGDAVKGLVIGNVQSGKTANMAGLMAMSADWGWNMFIVLSGTIENLRKQTQSRLFDDLNGTGNLNWRSLEHLSKQSPQGSRAQDLHFEQMSRERYFTVCLKNSARLRKLIQWLQCDQNKQRQMRILVIDDEADQAGINTGKIGSTEEDTERKTINRLIVSLVDGKNEKYEDAAADYEAMNYIGYTATPYANILNESGRESLYPRNFIATLGVSKEYFGPQQIFGQTGGDYDGLNIVRNISDDDLKKIKEIHDGNAAEIPESLKKAVCWFLDGVACRRLWNHHKPVTMLIHTSQRTLHHENLENALMNWLENSDKKELFEKCEEVWEEECEKFPMEMFFEEYPDYAGTDNVRDYPDFAEISPYLQTLIKLNPTHIEMSEEGDLQYDEGIHVCVDNCMNNGINEDGMYMRIAYPEREEDLDKTPAFIVIGGQTLSRGLTLEGLLCTYFLRSVGQADTLMQMGRWFGYRKGYEMLIRLWLTEKTVSQFRFLSDLDQDLRDEIFNMDITGKVPANYGPRVKNTPSYSFIRITAKNRMQSAQSTDVDYSGSFNQTYLFDNDAGILQNNLDATMEFIGRLGSPEIPSQNFRFAKTSKLWRNIDFSVIKPYLKKYHLQKNMHLASSIDSLIEWIEMISEKGNLNNWNIVLSDSSNEDNATISTPVGPIHLATRTKKVNEKTEAGIIDIGALRNPKDILADVDYDNLDDDIRDKIDHCTSGEIKGLRNVAGLNTTPQLILYFVNKDSKVSRRSKNGVSARQDLNAPVHLAGYCLNIPGGKNGQDYAATISIHMEDNVFDGSADLEGTDGD